jgi:hypothetical protein
MNKRGGWAIWISVVLVVVLVIVIFFYFALFNTGNDSIYRERELRGEIINPALSLSDEQIETGFNESFVYYLLYSIGAYNLHNPPLSGDKPLIWVIVNEDSYNAVVDNGEIVVQKGDPRGADIIIKTTKKEAIKMLRDKSYVKESFIAELSSIDLIAGKSKLFAKGYLGLYTQLTGMSITGNVVSMYTS